MSAGAKPAAAGGAGAPAVDLERLVSDLLGLLEVPSPTGMTSRAVERVEELLREIGVPSRRTAKGALVWTLAGEGGRPRAVASHIDTLGAMVKRIKRGGRLELTPIGGWDWATIEGAEARVHRFDGGEITGTVVNVKQSTHVHGPALRELRRTADTMELRLDALVEDRAAVEALGIGVGDFVSFDSSPRRAGGFVKGRHLDNKAAVAISLAATRAWTASGRRPDGDTHFFLSNYEEVGHGAAAGIPDGIAELLCIDMAAVGEGQASSETRATLCVKDSSGPYDEGMNRRLRELAAREGIDLAVDIYPYYGSDASAAWRAGGSFRAALIGPGVDASHAFERTHERALLATARLLNAYMATPLP